MPVLQVADVERSARFYRDKLGFRSHGTWGDGPDFAIVQRGRVTIALDRSRDPDAIPVNQHWAAYVYVEDADALCAEVRGNGVEIVRGPEDMPYGLRDFDIRDPDGHLIAFGHDLEPGEEDLKNVEPQGRGTKVDADRHRREGEWIDGNGAKATPLDLQPAWDLAQSGRIVAGRLVEILEEEGGKLTPELMRRLHDKLLQLSATLGSEATGDAKIEPGVYDGTKVDGVKVQATWILSGFLEEIESRRLPPRKA